MTTIYLIRHGESEANRRDVFLGHYDLHLTEIGRKQAQMTAAYLREQVGKPDAIYASDLARAYETAQATAACFDVPIIKVSDLREIDAGLWDNTPFSVVKEKYPESYGIWLSDIGNARCDGGESIQELQLRVVSAIRQITETQENSVIYIFTHATPIRVFAAYCLGKNLSEIKDIPWAANASVSKVVYENGSFQLLEYSCDEFMGELTTRLPSDV